MKDTKKIKCKLIEFEKYDTVRIMTLDTFTKRIEHTGLFLWCDSPNNFSLFGAPYEEQREVKMIVGSQRGENKSVRIYAYCGVKIFPVRMVLVEKMKKPEKKSLGF